MGIRLQTLWRSLRHRCRSRNLADQKFSKRSFLVLHYMWFAATCFVTSIIIWTTATETHPIRYIDALFMTISAMSEAGLTTVGLASLTTFQQAILLSLIFIGSAIFVSCAILLVRKHTFETKLQELAERRHHEILRLKGVAHQHSIISGCQYISLQTEIGNSLDLWDLPDTDDSHSQDNKHDRHTGGLLSQNARCSTASSLSKPGSAQISSSLGSDPVPCPQNQFIRETAQARPDCSSRSNSFSSFLLWPLDSTRSRNNFLKKTLSKDEKDRLGGIEYRALRFLTWVVPLYVLAFQLFGCIGCGLYLRSNRPEVARENDLNSFWTGAFFAVSAFNNNGMSLNDANMSALRTSYYMLLTLILLILAGNTCFPPFLRLILWSFRICARHFTQSKRAKKRLSTLEFILNHPRRLYTHLFPSEATWWLVLSLVVLNGIDWFAFEILNVTNPAVTDITPNFRVLNGLFQAFAVRKGGFFVVPLSDLYPGTLVLYIVMMYMNALPIRMAIATTGKYEEQSLEINPGEKITKVACQAIDGAVVRPVKSTRASLSFRGREGQIVKKASSSQITDVTPSSKLPTGRLPFFRDQLHGKLREDLWWIALAVFLITVIETTSVRRYPDVFSVFNIAFEVVSAWGTVGISTGLPWNVSSFCGAWHTASKLILSAMMMRGRHIGLPGAIDRAILLPEVSLAWSQAKDVHIVCECGNSFDDTISRPGDRPGDCRDFGGAE